MNTLQKASTSVVTRETVPYVATQGTPADVLASSEVDDRALWDEALEAILSWRSNPEHFAPEDRPDLPVVDAAIDYAVDVRDLGASPPSSIVPSGSGCVAFEWRAGEETLIVEFVDSGEAVLTRFVGNRVVEKERLIRDPLTRRLELEG